MVPVRLLLTGGNDVKPKQRPIVIPACLLQAGESRNPGERGQGVKWIAVLSDRIFRDKILMHKLQLQTAVPEALAGRRLDQALAALFPRHSRARLQAWITAGYVRVNDQNLKQKDRVKGADRIKINAIITEHGGDRPEAIPLAIIHEDDSLILVNKPAGLVVHPGAGNPEHTLVNALLHHDPGLSALPRAGIIHRLDKDTTGLLIIARTASAHTALVKHLQARRIKREYQAIVSGRVTAGGTIAAAIGRHPLQRKKMAVTPNGKAAITHYRLIKKYRHYTHLALRLETGRTHQIRVHLAHINHPLAGDPVYAKHKTGVKGSSAGLRQTIAKLGRQALHACRLTLPHPESGKTITCGAELPPDMRRLIEALERHDGP